MYGFEIGERVQVTNYLGRPVFGNIEGDIIFFEEKAPPRNEEYEGNPYTHWAVLEIASVKGDNPFSFVEGGICPTQFSEIKHVG